MCEARVKLLLKLLAFPAAAILLPSIVQADVGEGNNNSRKSIQSDDSVNETETLKITVTGTRTERSVDEIPASISIIDLNGIRNSGSTSLEDVLKYEPGVNIFSPKRNLYRDGSGLRGSTSRGNVNIRGMRASNNRIYSQVGGVRLPAGFYGQDYDYSGADYLDFNTLKTVDILKGSASALYGSDALGGVISYNYLEAEDIIEDGKNYGIEIPVNFSGYNTGKSAAIKWGGVNDEKGLSALAILSFEESGEILPKDHENVEKYINEIDRETNGYFINVKKDINDSSTVGIIFEKVERDTDHILASGNLTYGNTKASQEVESDSEKLILSWNYESQNAENFVDEIDAKVYFQNTLTSDMWHETRAGRDVKNTSDYDLTDDTIGGDIQITSIIDDHKLTYGIDISDTFNEYNQLKTFTTLSTGVSTNIERGWRGTTVYPIKRSPDSNTKRLGIYLQDEYSFGDFELLAGVRYDKYKLEVDTDKTFLNYCSLDGRSECPPVGELDEGTLNPNIALTYKVNDQLSTYGKYSRGFRGASWWEMNGNQINLSARSPYQTKGNPNVKPETSNSYEIGLRGDFKNNKFKLAGFYNNYEDFIGSEITGYETVGGVANVETSQVKNVSNANIWGLELNNELKVSNNVSIISAASYQEGEDETADQPLDHIDPFTVVTGFRYTTNDKKFVGELIATYLGKAEYSDSETSYLPESSTTLDLLAKYKVNNSLDVDLGISNLLDSSYYKYQNVRGVRSTADDLKKYAEPGRSLNAGFKFKF